MNSLDVPVSLGNATVTKKRRNAYKGEQARFNAGVLRTRMNAGES